MKCYYFNKLWCIDCQICDQLDAEIRICVLVSRGTDDTLDPIPAKLFVTRKKKVCLKLPCHHTLFEKEPQVQYTLEFPQLILVLNAAKMTMKTKLTGV